MMLQYHTTLLTIALFSFAMHSSSLITAVEHTPPDKHLLQIHCFRPPLENIPSGSPLLSDPAVFNVQPQATVDDLITSLRTGPTYAPYHDLQQHEVAILCSSDNERLCHLNPRTVVPRSGDPLTFIALPANQVPHPQLLDPEDNEPLTDQETHPSKSLITEIAGHSSESTLQQAGAAPSFSSGIEQLLPTRPPFPARIWYIVPVTSVWLSMHPAITSHPHHAHGHQDGILTPPNITANHRNPTIVALKGLKAGRGTMG